MGVNRISTGRSSGRKPQDHVRRDVPAWARQALALVLQRGADVHPGVQAKGWANCRICGAQLGSGDLTAFGHVWPEKAEHYILTHGVWTPGCEALLQAALRHGRA
jgi:hypothetical protein